MRRERIVRPKQRTAIALSLLDSELDELIECVAHAADRAESGSYDKGRHAQGQGDSDAKSQASLCPRQPPGKGKAVIASQEGRRMEGEDAVPWVMIRCTSAACHLLPFGGKTP